MRKKIDFETMRKIDFGTMRENCINIYDEVARIYAVAEKAGIDKQELQKFLIVSDANELTSHELTKTIEGMGKYAKQLFEATALWDLLPSRQIIPSGFISDYVWLKQEAKTSLQESYVALIG
ncbi:MAG: hypothetical protein LBU27_00540 [Candidatus Peribacteria bacterium]|jgi:hypothetical protein|nr:hypothetical protein [Candidatus Peribacteria bacterium]